MSKQANYDQDNYDDNLVTISNISKNFHLKPILKNVSFSLKKGLITTLIGQNGAGKTTIARMIIGLEKQTSGKITIKPGISMGYVPQKLDYYRALPLNGHALLKMLAPKYDADTFNYLNDFLKFHNLLNSEVSELSGGQLQNLILMATILNRPDLLILDEPTQYLDVTSQQQFYKILSWLKITKNTSIFIISHDLFAVMRNSDEVICINEHICCTGKPDNIVSNQLFQSIMGESKNNPKLSEIISQRKMAEGDVSEPIYHKDPDNNDLSKTKDALGNKIDSTSEIGIYLHKHDHKHDS